MDDTRPLAVDDMLDAVVRAAGRHLAYPRELGPDDADADLAALGLSSLGMMSLLVELEQLWSVQLPTERIVPETFASPRALAGAFGPLVESSTDSR
jgi:acyl carrier protein